MKRICLTLSLLALLAVMSAPLSAVGLSYCDGVAGNLIANCGFETGDFTDWALAGADPVDSLVTTESTYVSSGEYGAQLGPIGGDGTLTQTFNGAGFSEFYVDFELMNDFGTPNDFTVLWNGVDVGPDLVNADAFSFEQFYGYLPGNPGANTITFQFLQDPAYWGLDDIVVKGQSTVPEPGSLGLLLSGLGVLAVAIRRRMK
jgi:hypothetical protein